MKRLSSNIDSLKPHYEIIIVGSGYGGGIAAARLARAGKDVCVLERGKELHPGEYPDTPAEIVRQVQSDLPHKHFGSPTGLFDFRYNPDINVIVGCGLGGTSLINAGILLRPDPRIFQDPVWPEAIRKETRLDSFFLQAAAMLKPALYPDNRTAPAKFAALEQCARELNREIQRVPVAVNFDTLPSDTNHVGVTQYPCNDCGDCVSGCNNHAKNTVLMNYLPYAVKHGARIFTEVVARHIERRESVWRVHCHDLRHGRSATLSANTVILAAGTLGSTELLLRSREAGLSISDEIGRRFSANGDTIGFAYNADQAVHGVGFGNNPPESMHPVGPCSTGLIDLRDGQIGESMIMVDGAIPGALARLVPATLAVTAKAIGIDTDTGIRDKIEEIRRVIESKLLGAYSGAMKNTLFFLVVSEDDARGEMFLHSDRLRIRWPGLGDQKPFHRASDLMERATSALGGTYVPNPVWSELTDHNLLTGHPLGGCVLADDARGGVVNHKGQVYNKRSGDSTHDGLYVMDGAIIPRALGANPLFTISALAERNCSFLVGNE